MIRGILITISIILLLLAVVIAIFLGIKNFKTEDNSNEIDEIKTKYRHKIDKLNKWDNNYEEQKEALLDEMEKEVNEYQRTHPQPTKKNTGFISAIIVSVALLAFTITVPGSFHQIETGEVAVVRHLGKIVDVKQPGTHFSFYMTNQYETYDTKVQQDHILTAAYSKDGQTMELEVFLQYQIQSENVLKIATEYGSLYALQSRIETQTIEKTKAVMSSAEAMTIIQNRAQFSNSVSEAVRNGISDDYYVNVKDVVLTNIDFTDAFEKSVEDKVIAEQQKQAAITKAEAELEVAKLEAQKKIEEARGNAESTKIIAQASAEAATYNIVELSRVIGYVVNETYIYSVDGIETEYATKQLETDTIIYLGTKYVIDTTTGPGTDNFKALVEDYIKYIEYLSAWNGELPNVVAGDNAISIIVP